VQRIEHVDLEEDLIADVISIERDSFDKADVCYESGPTVVCVTAIADGQSMINRQTDLMDMRVHCDV